MEVVHFATGYIVGDESMTVLTDETFLRILPVEQSHKFNIKVLACFPHLIPRK
jgi:hypothetical protein